MVAWSFLDNRRERNMGEEGRRAQVEDGEVGRIQVCQVQQPKAGDGDDDGDGEGEEQRLRSSVVLPVSTILCLPSSR